ncbi:MAG: hypothetical protein U1E24_14470 [Phenylobacterium sp.]|nr:hypothetical protein [Phenylobacterium sp.]
MTPRLTVFAGLAAALSLAACSPATEPAAEADAAGGEVNVYSARHYDVDQKLYEQFTGATGIKVNIIEGSAPQLIARMQSEGAASPADDRHPGKPPGAGGPLVRLPAPGPRRGL